MNRFGNVGIILHINQTNIICLADRIVSVDLECPLVDLRPILSTIEILESYFEIFDDRDDVSGCVVALHRFRATRFSSGDFARWNEFLRLYRGSN